MKKDEKNSFLVHLTGTVLSSSALKNPSVVYYFLFFIIGLQGESTIRWYGLKDQAASA